MYPDKIKEKIMAKSVRISDAAVEEINDLIELTGESKKHLIDRAIFFYARAQIHKKANEQYAELQKDPVAWKEILEERAEWDSICSTKSDNHDKS